MPRVPARPRVTHRDVRCAPRRCSLCPPSSDLSWRWTTCGTLQQPTRTRDNQTTDACCVSKPTLPKVCELTATTAHLNSSHAICDACVTQESARHRVIAIYGPAPLHTMAIVLCRIDAHVCDTSSLWVSRPTTGLWRAVRGPAGIPRSVFVSSATKSSCTYRLQRIER